MTTAHGKSLVAHGRQGWLEIGAIDSYEKMDLCMRLIIGLLPLSLSYFNKYQHEGTWEQETERYCMVILSDILTVTGQIFHLKTKSKISVTI